VLVVAYTWLGGLVIMFSFLKPLGGRRTRLVQYLRTVPGGTTLATGS